MEIIINCHTCYHYNRQEMGTKEYEFKPYEFNSFSEAHEHAMNNPDHYMSFIVRKDDEE